MQEQQKQLRLLSGRVVAAQEDERRRISRELHDEMGQALTAIKLNLQILITTLPPENKSQLEQVNEIIALTNTSLQEVRRLAMDLRPSILDDLGLVPTLRWYQSQFIKRSDTEFDLSVPANFPRLAPEAETALYRVVQEAVTNISRHAQAKKVEISLSHDAQTVYCSIIDDGIGFKQEEDTSPVITGVGLTSMRERVEALNGEINISSSPQAGTEIDIKLPLQVASPSEMT